MKKDQMRDFFRGSTMTRPFSMRPGSPATAFALALLLLVTTGHAEELSTGLVKEQPASGRFVKTEQGYMVPYTVTITTGSNHQRKTVRETRYLHLLPETLEVNGSVTPETRYRGIYEAVVYKSTLRLSGRFPTPDWEVAKVNEDEIQKSKAWLTIGISDARGIREPTTLTLNGQELEPMPGLPTQEVITRDNAMVSVDGVVFFQILDAAKDSQETGEVVTI